MLIAARQFPGQKIDGNKVLAWSGVLVGHILLLGVMFLPREPTFFTPEVAPETYTPVIDFYDPPPPLPPIRVEPLPPSPINLQVVPIVKPVPMAAAPAPPTNTPQTSENAVQVPDGVLPATPSSGPALSGPIASAPMSLRTDFAPPPAYPRREQARGIGGVVELRVLVGADGLPKSIAVAGGSGVRALELAAIRAVKRWRFVPHQVDGVPQSAYALVPIVFRIDGN